MTLTADTPTAEGSSRGGTNARQAEITQELSELIAGADSLASS